jgi:hypothetical protein
MDNLNIILVMLTVILMVCLSTMSTDNEEGYDNTGGCHECYTRNRAGDLMLTECGRPWQENHPLNCKCTTCYDPQYYNNFFPFRHDNEKLINYNSKVCHCTPCNNSKLSGVPY